jgi:hypothetical protein
MCLFICLGSNLIVFSYVWVKTMCVWNLFVFPLHCVSLLIKDIYCFINLAI